jgi:hypothetical protein
MNQDITTYVYVIGHLEKNCTVGPVKVGVTKNPYDRLATLQTSCPSHLVMIHAFAAPNREIALGLEEAFHTVFKDRRLRGEWFDMHPIDAAVAMAENVRSLLSTHLEFSAEETAEAMALSCGTLYCLTALVQRGKQ